MVGGEPLTDGLATELKALVDGKIWSSGTKKRARTAHLRRDPRSTLFIFDSTFRWLSLECRVNILEGSEVPQQSLRLFQVMQAGMTPTSASHACRRSSTPGCS
jgi:hypothetical protein